VYRAVARRGIFYLEAPRLKQQAFADLNAIAEPEGGPDRSVAGRATWRRRGPWRQPGFIEDAVRAARDEDVGARQRIVERLETLKRAYAYDGVVVVDGSANQSSPRIKRSQCRSAGPESAADGLRPTRVATTDLYRSESGRVHLDWVAPLVKEIDGRRQAVGAVILDTPVERVVFPLIQSWPTPSPSAETLLVRREGDSCVVSERIAPSQGHGAGLQASPR
jgi:hypothetical protein